LPGVLSPTKRHAKFFPLFLKLGLRDISIAAWAIAILDPHQRAQLEGNDMPRSSRPSSAVAISKTGKTLHGTAAQLRIAALAGGHDRYNRSLMESAATEAVQQFWLKVVTHFVLTPYQETQSKPRGEANNTRHHDSGALTFSIPQAIGGLHDAKH